MADENITSADTQEGAQQQATDAQLLDDLTSLQQATEGMDDAQADGQVATNNEGDADNPSMTRPDDEFKDQRGLPEGGTTDTFALDNTDLQNSNEQSTTTDVQFTAQNTTQDATAINLDNLRIDLEGAEGQEGSSGTISGLSSPAAAAVPPADAPPTPTDPAPTPSPTLATPTTTPSPTTPQPTPTDPASGADPSGSTDSGGNNNSGTSTIVTRELSVYKSAVVTLDAAGTDDGDRTTDGDSVAGQFIDSADDEITYTIVVDNTGNQNLSSLVITDAKLSADTDYELVLGSYNGTSFIPATSGGSPITITTGTLTNGQLNLGSLVLAPNEALQLVFTYVVTEEDIAGNQFVNTVLVDSDLTSRSGPLNPDGTDDADPKDGVSYATTPIRTPELKLDKSAVVTTETTDFVTDGTGTDGAKGSVDSATDVISYTLTATNAGNTALTNVKISDTMFGNGATNVLITIKDSDPTTDDITDRAVTYDEAGKLVIGGLAVGQYAEVTYTYTVTAGDLDATANPDKDIDNEARAFSSEDNSDIEYEVVSIRTPELKLDKSAVVTTETTDFVTDGTGTDGAKGSVDSATDVISYTLTATNAGNTALTNVKISDTMFGNGATNVLITIKDSDPTTDDITDRAVTYDEAGKLVIGGLAVGQYAEVTYTYTVTAGDLDATANPDKDIDNEARAFSSEDNSDIEYEVVSIRTPELKLDKSAVVTTETTDFVTDGTGTDGAKGSVDSATDVISYTLTATNAGNTALTNVKISDTMFGNGATNVLITIKDSDPTTDDITDRAVTYDEAGKLVIGGLAVGQYAEVTYTYTVTAGDLDATANPDKDIDNEARAFSSEDNSDIEYEVVSIRTPELKLDKSAVVTTETTDFVTDGTGTDGAKGSVDSATDVISYTLTATNAGNTALTNVKISDTMFGNGATNVLITIKDSDPTTDDITDRAVTYDEAGKLVIGGLAVGQYAEVTYTYTVTAGDLDATANPDKDIDNEARAFSSEDNSDIEYEVVSIRTPELKLDKSAVVTTETTDFVTDGTGTDGAKGSVDSATDVISYTLTATNAGNTALTNVKISDTMFGNGATNVLITIKDSDPTTDDITDRAVTYDEAGKLVIGGLAVGQYAEVTYTYTVTAGDLDATANPDKDIDNEARAFSSEDNSDIEYEVVSIRTPELKLDKSAVVTTETTDFVTDGTGTDGAKGSVDSATDVISYTLTATNAGNTALTNVKISDTMFGNGATNVLITIKDSDPTTDDITDRAVTYDEAGKLVIGGLAVGQYAEVTYTYTVTAGDLDATANPDKDIDNEARAFSSEDNSDIEYEVVSIRTPELKLDKSAVVTTETTDFVTDGTGTDGAKGSVDSATDVISYTLTATNAGNTALTNVKISDTMFGNGATNVLITIKDSDPTTDDITDRAVTYDEAGKLVIGGLAVGQYAEVTYTYTVTAGDLDATANPDKDIDNEARAFSSEDNSDIEYEVVSIRTPELKLDKSAVVTTETTDFVTDGTGTDGAKGSVDSATDVISYTLTATNAGNTALTNVKISDTMFGNGATNVLITIKDSDPTTDDITDRAVTYDEAGKLVIGGLAVGQYAEVTYTYTVTAGDLDATANPDKDIDNEARAFSSEDNSDIEYEVVSIRTPELKLTKSAIVTDVGGDNGNDFGGIRSSGSIEGGAAGKIDSAGDEIAYTLTAGNAGNTTLHNVKVFDAMFNLANDQLLIDSDPNTADEGRQLGLTIYHDVNGVPTEVSTGFVTVESNVAGSTTSYFVTIPTLAVGQYAKIDYVYVVTDAAINASSQPVATSIFDSTSDFRSDKPLNFEVGGNVVGSVVAYTDEYDDEKVNPYSYSYDSSENQALFVNSDNTGRAIGVGAGVMSGMRSGNAAENDHIRVNGLDQGNTTGFKFSVTNATAVEIAFQAQYGSADTKFDGSIVIHKDGTFDLYRISNGAREPLSANQREWLTVEQEAGPGGAQNIIHTIAFRPEGESLDFFDFWVVGHETRNNEVQIKVVDIQLEKLGVIENTAFATSNEDVYDVSKVDQYASYQIDVAAGPDLELTKSAIVTDIGGVDGNDFGGIRSSNTLLGGTAGKIDSAGDQVAYTLIASNTGNTTLNNVKVFDAMFNVANDQLATDNNPATTADADRQVSLTVYNADGGEATARAYVTVQAAIDPVTSAVTGYFVNVPTLGIGQYAKIDYVYIVTIADISNFNNASGSYSIKNQATATADEDVYSTSKVDQIATYDIELVNGGESDLEIFKSAVVDSNGDEFIDYTFDSKGDSITYTITVLNRGEIETNDKVRIYDAMFQSAVGNGVLVDGIKQAVQTDGSNWFIEIDPISAGGSVELTYEYKVTDSDLSGSAKSLLSLLDGVPPRGPLGFGPFDLKGNLGTVLAYQDVDNQKLYDLDFDKTEVRQLFVNTDNTGTAIGVGAGVMAGDRNGYRDHLLLSFNDSAPVTSTSISFTNATAIEVAFKAGYTGTTSTGSVRISNTGVITEFNAGGSSLIDITGQNSLFDLSVVSGPGGAQNRIYTITFQSPDASLDYFDFWVVGSSSDKNFNNVQLKVVDVTLSSPSSIENTAVAVIGAELPSNAPEDQVAKYNVDYGAGISVGELLILINEKDDQFLGKVGSLVDEDVDGNLFKYEIAGGNGSEKQGIWGKLEINSDGRYSYTANSQSAVELGDGDVGLDTFVVNISGDGVTSQKIVRVSLIGDEEALTQTIVSISEDDLTFGGVLPTAENGREYLFEGDSGSPVSAEYKGSFDYVAEGDHGQLYLNSNTGEYQYVFEDQALYQDLFTTSPNELLDKFTVVFDDGLKREIIVNVFGVNDAPESTNDSVTTDEDTPKVLALTDFGTYSDPEGTAISAIKITTLENNGSLEYQSSPGNWVAVTLNQEIAAADITAGKLRFKPDENESGTTYATVGFKVSDGTDFSATANTLTVNVTPVNDAPESTNDSVTTDEDTPKVLALTDFGTYSDPEGTAISAIKITTLENNGSLEYQSSPGNWVAVTLNQEIAAADITAGKLRFKPDENESGTTYATVGFKVSDGTDFSATANTLTVNVTPVNDAPESTNDSVTTDEDTPKVLALTDFGTYSDPEGTAISAIKITTLENNGSLEYQSSPGNWVAVTLNQEIAAADITAGKLRFKPDENESGTTYATVGFKVSDGTDFSATANTLTVNVTPVNDAPESTNDSVTTDEDTPKVLALTDFGTYSDPEGTAISAIKITTLENNGSLEYQSSPGNWVAVTLNQEIAAADITAGKLRFKPDENESGTTYATVGFKVSDGTDFSATANTLTVNVTPVNDAPESTNDSVTTDEDTPKVLALTDFGTYSDPEGTAISAIKITTLENNGSLEYQSSPGNWVAVTLNQEIAAADITAGKLRFKPDENESGTTYATVGFKVSDGTDFSATANTLTVNVTPVNDAPESTNDSVTTDEDTPKVLALTDFGTYSDPEGTAISAIKITTLENNGSLEYQSSPGNWVAVTLNQEIAAADITAGKLRFKPDENESGTTYATVGFKVSDGTDFSATANTLTVNVTPVNDAPTGTVSISGVAKRGQVLTATNNLADADGLGTIGYQWYAAGVEISSATNSTLTLTQSEVGKTITVKASYTDLSGTPESVLSSATPAVAIPNFGTLTLTYSSTGSGNNTVRTITASLNDADDEENVSYSWSSDKGTVTVSPFNPNIIILKQDDLNNGSRFTVNVSYSDIDGSQSISASMTPTVSTASVSVTSTKPITLDLNNDGIEYLSTSAGVTYDYDGDGVAGSTAWVSPEDGLLALSQEDGSLKIVFSTQDGETDLQGLAKIYDSNQDGQLNQLDTFFNQFGVWQDADSDGVVDSGEFQSLTDREIMSLDLVSDGIERTEAGGDIFVYGQTTYTKADGTTGLADDAAFVVRSSDEATTKTIQIGNSGEVVHVPDFGTNDQIDLSTILANAAITRDNLKDYVQLVDGENGTVLNIDTTGHGGEGGWVQVASLDNVHVSQAGVNMFFDPTNQTIDFTQSSPEEWKVEDGDTPV